jgi:hypothetical protein
MRPGLAAAALFSPMLHIVPDFGDRTFRFWSLAAGLVSYRNLLDLELAVGRNDGPSMPHGIGRLRRAGIQL